MCLVSPRVWFRHHLNLWECQYEPHKKGSLILLNQKSVSDNQTIKHPIRLAEISHILNIGRDTSTLTFNPQTAH